MKIKIEFHTDNAAFAEDFTGSLRSLLQQAHLKVAERIAWLTPVRAKAGTIDQLRDVNGNTIGTVAIEQ